MIFFSILFPFKDFPFDDGLTYLGYRLNPYSYSIKDWDQLISKCEIHISNWGHRYLSKGVRLILVKVVLEAILVYWMNTQIPLGVIDIIRKLYNRFMWSSSLDNKGMAWISFKALAFPKCMWDQGFKIPILFAKALAAKNIWRLISSMGLRVKIVVQKYITSLKTMEWIHSLNKSMHNISIYWKSVVSSFDLVGR